MRSIVIYSSFLKLSNTYVLTKFNGEDIVKCIKSTYGKCTCRFWWVQNDKYNDDINKIINSLENSLSMTSESCSKSK